MEQQNAAGAPAKRPTFLTVLCILSFIAAGFAIIGYITAITLMGAATAVVSAADDAMEAASDSLSASYSEMSAAMDQAMSSGPSMGLTWAYVIIGFVCTLVGLYGVIKMWKLKKVGFYMYTGASVVSMIMGIVYSGFGVMAVIFPIAFIVMYGLNLKHME
jgi:hypothetical protein